jgi:hypothetical protein
MKRIEKVGLAIALTAGLSWFVVANADSVEIQNIVGMQNLEIVAENFNMIGINWEAPDGGALDIYEVLDTSVLTGGPTLADADNIYIWDAVTDQYETYFLGPDGYWYEPASPPAKLDAREMKRGTALWLLTRGDTNVISTVAGQVPMDTPTNMWVRANTFNMVGSSYTADLILNSGFDWLAAGAQGGPTLADADNIYIWNAHTSMYEVYFLGPDGNWYEPTSPPSIAVGAKITMGKGAWYLSKADSDWQWFETKPY